MSLVVLSHGQKQPLGMFILKALGNNSATGQGHPLFVPGLENTNDTELSAIGCYLGLEALGKGYTVK